MEGAKWIDIRNDRLKGMSYTELGKKYHIDPRTAKRYAESPQKPEYTLSAPKPTKLDEYKQQVDQWLEEAPYSAVRILEKLKEQGFEGNYSIVKEHVRSRKMDLDEKATVRFETMPGKQGQMDWGFFEEHGCSGSQSFFSSLPDAMKRPLPSSPLTKHSPSRTRSFLTSPSPPLFSTAPFTTVPLSTLRVNPAASKNARNSCDRNSRLSIPFLSKAMPDSLHLSSADILQKFLAVFLHF